MRFLCEKDKKSKSVVGICHAWFEFMLEQSTSRPPVPNPWAEDGSASSEQVQAASTGPARPNVMEYDDRGAAVDPRQTVVESQGILPGARVRNKTGGAPHEVVSVSSMGGVVLKPVRADGTLGPTVVAIPYDGFLSNYVFDKRSTSTTNVKWPAVDIGTSKPFIVEFHRCRIFAAMYDYYQDVDPVELTIKQEPHRGVFVDARYTVGKLCLPLASTKLGAYEKTKQGDMAWKVFPTGSQAMAAHGPSDQCYCFCSTGVKGQFAAAWAIRPVFAEEEANCVIKLKQHPKDDAYEDIRLPFVTNFVVLKKGDELKIFKKAKQIARKPEPTLKRTFDSSSAPAAASPAGTACSRQRCR